MVGIVIFTLLGLAAWLLLSGDRRRLADMLRGRYRPGRGGGDETGAPGVPRERLARGSASREVLAQWRNRSSRRRARSSEHLDDLPLLIHELATLLEAGRNPTRLWRDAARVCRSRERDQPEALWGVFAEVFDSCARNTELGFSASYALAGESQQEGIPPLVQRCLGRLGVCVAVSEESGAPLTSILRRFAEQTEDEIDADLSRKAILAGPRATAKLLAWLPVFGLLLGMLAGADVMSIFLGTPWGMVLFSVGIALMLVGKVWADRLVQAAEVPPP